MLPDALSPNPNFPRPTWASAEDARMTKRTIVKTVEFEYRFIRGSPMWYRKELVFLRAVNSESQTVNREQ
jgi:hypothetical protein